ncbi:MAG TPA: BamA/TamA family outer membrane protein [Steroidobacteraceae bacterium]|jgi:outer membrane protein assembly factor BamA
MKTRISHLFTLLTALCLGSAWMPAHAQLDMPPPMRVPTAPANTNRQNAPPPGKPSTTAQPSPTPAARPGSQLVIEDIRCEGIRATSCDFIRSHLGFGSGATVDEERIGEVRLRLALLPRFESVDVRLEKGTRRGAAILVIHVVESNPIAAVFNAGAVYRYGGFTQTAGAEVVDRDLFGFGRSLSFSALGSWEDSGRAARESLLRLQYFDSRLFGSPDYLLVARAFYTNADYAYASGSQYNNRFSGVSVAIGRRLGANSSLSVGYRYLTSSSLSSTYWTTYRGLQTFTGPGRSAALFTYTHQTEDDPNFPTDGSLLALFTEQDLTRNDIFMGGELRQTWSVSDHSWLQMQLRHEGGYQFRASLLDEPDVALYYTRTLSGFNLFGDTTRARWYIGAGFSHFVNDSRGEQLTAAGIRAGVKLQTRAFGLLNFYIAADGPPYVLRF